MPSNPKPKRQAKRPAQPKKVCRCPCRSNKSMNQRVNVAVGARGVGPPPTVVHQMSAPFQPPPIMPQFVFPTSNGFGDPRFAVDRESIRRNDHHYNPEASAGRIDPTPRTPVAQEPDVARDNITPIERHIASQPREIREIRLSLDDMNKTQLVEQVVRLQLLTRVAARQLNIDQLRETLIEKLMRD